MTNIVLALGHPHGAASTPGTGTYWFAIGLLAGIAAAWWAPGWLTWLIIIGDLVALGWSTGILRYIDSATGRWVLIGAAFLLVGLFLGLKNGLRALGDSEFRARLTNIRRMGRWF